MRGEGPWYYQQIELGFNYRMTDIQAALGASQMQRIDEFVSRRASSHPIRCRLCGYAPDPAVAAPGGGPHVTFTLSG